MRELHASTLASLDGFHEADGAYSFADGYQDSEWVKYANEMFRNYDTLLAGRVTYELYRQYQASDEAAPSEETMNAQDLVVFSNTLTDEEVGNATRYQDDLVGNVKALKEQPGKDILCIGSRSLRSQLFNAGLIDRMKIWYVPIALGKGNSVFEGLDKPVQFKLMRSYTFHNGLIRLEYDVLKPGAES
jgi:dihydrofolate reductase